MLSIIVAKAKNNVIAKNVFLIACHFLSDTTNLCTREVISNRILSIYMVNCSLYLILVIEEA